MTTRTHGRRRAALAAAMVVFALAGCSTSSKSSSPTSGAADRAEAPVPQGAPAQGGGKVDAVPPGTVPTNAPSVASRAIIYTGSITVRVDNLQEAATRVGAIAKSVVGGYV